MCIVCPIEIFFDTFLLKQKYQQKAGKRLADNTVQIKFHPDLWR